MNRKFKKIFGNIRIIYFVSTSPFHHFWKDKMFSLYCNNNTWKVQKNTKDKMQASNKSHSYMSVHTLVCQEMFHLRTITTFIANVWPNLDAPRGNKYYLDRQDINKLLPSFLHPFLFNYRRKTIKGEHLFSSSYLYIY